MADLQDDYLILPESELKKIYRRKEKWQKRLSVIPIFLGVLLAVIHTVSGFVYLTIISPLAEPYPIILEIVFYLAVLIHGVCLLADNISLLNRSMICFTAVYTALYLLMKLYGSDINLLHIIFPLYFLAVHIIDIRLIKTLNMMRQLPTFPFDEERRKMICESSLSREQMTEYLKRMDKRECTHTDFEKILDGNCEYEIQKEPDKSEFLQQHQPYYK